MATDWQIKWYNKTHGFRPYNLGDFPYFCFVNLLRYSTPHQDEALGWGWEKESARDSRPLAGSCTGWTETALLCIFKLSMETDSSRSPALKSLVRKRGPCRGRCRVVTEGWSCRPCVCTHMPPVARPPSARRRWVVKAAEDWTVSTWPQSPLAAAHPCPRFGPEGRGGLQTGTRPLTRLCPWWGRPTDPWGPMEG